MFQLTKNQLFVLSSTEALIPLTVSRSAIKSLLVPKKYKKKTYPTVTSKILEPTEDDTAMSPFPCLATRTLVIRSGTEVPAARNVRPIT